LEDDRCGRRRAPIGSLRRSPRRRISPERRIAPENNGVIEAPCWFAGSDWRLEGHCVLAWISSDFRPSRRRRFAGRLTGAARAKEASVFRRSYATDERSEGDGKNNRGKEGVASQHRHRR
jgi:hypothetical protein